MTNPPTPNDAESEAERVEHRWSIIGTMGMAGTSVRAVPLADAEEALDAAERQLHEARTQLAELQENSDIWLGRAIGAEAQLKRCQEALRGTMRRLEAWGDASAAYYEARSVLSHPTSPNTGETA